ncbi:MAG: hypothetical protein U1E97_04895 [Alphaproteobacteria bacterium]
MAQSLLGNLPHVIHRQDIAAQEDRIAAAGLDGRHHLVAGGTGAAVDHNAAAFGRQLHGDGLANPARSPGDDDHFPL